MRATLVAVAVALAAAALSAVALGDPNQPGERYTSVEWQPDPNDGAPAGRKIKVIYGYDGFACQYRFHRAAARETGSTVTIKVLAHWRPMGEDQFCTLEKGGGFTTVKLKEPLGDRELRHAPTDDPGSG